MSLRDRLADDRPLALGVAASVVWLLLVVLFALLGPEAAAPASGWARIGMLAGILTPLGLIWLAVGTARALVDLRAEASDLRAEMTRITDRMRAPEAGATAGPAVSRPLAQPDVAMREAAPRAAPAASPAQRGPAAAARQPSIAAAAAGRRMAAAPRPLADPQSSLDLGGPAPVEVDRDDLIRALNFPDSPDDTSAIAALRSALRDPETARLIRAAQDVVMLLAGRGLYMDDRPPAPQPPELWRRLAEGQRGAALSALIPDMGPDGGEAVAAALRTDEVFRDTAHHFLRRWDRMLAREVQGLDDARLMALADTRSARAFLLLAQASGSLA